MALNAYVTQTQRLLQLPAAPVSLYSTDDIKSYINTARGQLAGEAECIRYLPDLSLVQSQQVYTFASVNLNSSTTGIQKIMHVRQIWVVAGTGQLTLTPRPFPWFGQYELNTANPIENRPTTWSQYGQGSDYGTIYFSPIPDQGYTANLDCVCLPVDLVDDTTKEAIPSLWTDAVPYFAAYMALLSAQSSARQADAQRYFNIYTEFVNRARRFATPDVLTSQYEQQANPTRTNLLGMKPPKAGAA